MNIVSACCGAGIEIGSRTEYPLGGRTYGESLIVDVCGYCGQEAEPVHTCEYCGSELNGDNPEIRFEEDVYCHSCVFEIAVKQKESVVS